MVEYFRLKELAKEHSMILVDACALFGVYRNGDSSRSARKSADFFKESKNRDVDFYVTDKIAHEYLTVNGGGFACKQGNDLIKSLKSDGKIISPNEEQQKAIACYAYRYDEKIRKRLRSSNRPLLSENDLELLLLGAFLSETQRTAIITNDVGIHIGAEHILSREKDLQLELFMRMGDNKFMSMTYKKI